MIEFLVVPAAVALAFGLQIRDMTCRLKIASVLASSTETPQAASGTAAPSWWPTSSYITAEQWECIPPHIKALLQPTTRPTRLTPKEITAHIKALNPKDVLTLIEILDPQPVKTISGTTAFQQVWKQHA